MNPEDKFGKQITLEFSANPEKETTPAQELVEMRNKVCLDNNINEPERVNLKNDVWCYDDMAIEQYVSIRSKTAEENNILNPEILRLENNVWYVGPISLEDYNQIHADGNKQVIDEKTGNYI